MNKGQAPHSNSRLPYLVGVFFIGLFWVLSLLFVVVMLYEFGLPYIRSALGTKPDRLDPLTRAGYYKTKRDGNPYAPFYVQHLHPLYFFYFPLDPMQRNAMNNEIVSITADGFRGPGPSPEKPLAILLGASAVFGDKASSDQTTITAYLNRMQSDFHFVAAGVPSWTSSQELHRLAGELVGLKPKLVVSYSFSNDILVALRYAQRGISYPPGTPESFDELARRVDDLRAPPRRELARYVFGLFPRTTRKLREMRRSSPPRHVSENEILAAIEKAADKFVLNQTAMRFIADGGGFRFVTVLQPSLRTHKNVTKRYRATDWWFFSQAVERIVASQYCKSNCLNYSDLFDKDFAEVPVYREEELARDIRSRIFADLTHLLDVGNEYVARTLVQDLKLRPIVSQR